MSIDLFYPENQTMARRVEELIDDMTFMQGEVVQDCAFLDKSDTRIRPTMDSLMKKYGLTSYDDLVAKVLGSLPPEDKAAVQSLVDHFKEVGGAIQDTFGLTLMIGFVAGVTAVSIRTGLLISTGAYGIVAKSYAFGLRLILTGDAKAGAALLKSTSRLSAALVDNLAEDSKIARGFRTAATVAEVLGVITLVIDGVLVILAAVEGAQQRDALKEKIKEMFARRLVCQFYETCTIASFSCQGQIESYLTIADNANIPDSAKAITLDALAQGFIDSVKDNLKGIDTQSCYDALHTKDTNRGSWMDEDPKYDSTLQIINDLGLKTESST